MKTLVFVLLIISFFACNEQKSNRCVEHIQAMKIDSDLFMGLPVVIKIFPQDSVLWISDFSTNYLISGVHKNTGAVLCQIIQKGNGPSEMTPPVHLFFKNRDMCLYDRNKRKLYRTYKDSILMDKSRSLHEVTSFSNGYSLIYNLTDSTYIGTGFFEKRFSITDSKGEELYQTGELPKYWSDEHKLPDRVRSMYHQTIRLCQHPSRPFIATCTSDVLTAYSIESNLIHETFQIPLHDYAFDYNDGKFVSANKRSDVPIGIRDVACDSEYIYVLYNPNSEEDLDKVNSEIRLYDWSGTFIKTVIPNINLSIMTLDIAENTIYGISIDDEPTIWKVQLGASSN